MWNEKQLLDSLAYPSVHGGSTVFRKSICGLAIFVMESFNLYPFSRNLLVSMW
jgi:hypothetical protein